MLTTLSTTRSATSGIAPSVSTAGAACAGVVPERSAAPVPSSPTTAAAAMSVRSGVIGSSLVTNLGPCNRLPLFLATGRPIGREVKPPSHRIRNHARIRSNGGFSDLSAPNRDHQPDAGALGLVASAFGGVAGLASALGASAFGASTLAGAPGFAASPLAASPLAASPFGASAFPGVPGLVSPPAGAAPGAAAEPAAGAAA